MARIKCVMDKRLFETMRKFDCELGSDQRYDQIIIVQILEEIGLVRENLVDHSKTFVELMSYLQRV